MHNAIFLSEENPDEEYCFAADNDAYDDSRALGRHYFCEVCFCLKRMLDSFHI